MILTLKKFVRSILEYFIFTLKNIIFLHHCHIEITHISASYGCTLKYYYNLISQKYFWRISLILFSYNNQTQYLNNSPFLFADYAKE
jgi:hypothetical protein